MLARVVFAIVVAVFAVTQASAADTTWGAVGHSMSGAIAMEFLTPKAVNGIKRLLPDGNLAAIASWADDVRPSMPWSAPLHFINTPDWLCNFDPARDCHNNGCVHGAIQNYTSRTIDNKVPVDQQIQAIKFLVHFLGDIHQPLHVAFITDKGGNSITGKFMNAATNLHSMWDTALLVKRIQDEYHTQANYTTWIVKQLKGPWANLVNSWKSCKVPGPISACSTEWANESLKLACTYAYVDVDGKTHIANGFNLGVPYWSRVWPIIEQQIAKAGIRLANILNHMFP